MRALAAIALLLPGLLAAHGSSADVAGPCDAATPCAGLRPGARLLNGCTLGWVLRDGGGETYVATAGHCTADGMRMATEELGEFGTVVLREASGLGADFALIRVDAGMRTLVDPSMCVFGGPRAAAGAAEPGLVYAMHGWGEGAPRPARIGPEAAPPVEFLLWGAHVRPGDSGSPVLALDGRAMGLATHAVTIGPLGLPVIDPQGNMAAGTPLWRILAGARAAGLDLALVTTSEDAAAVPEA